MKHLVLAAKFNPPGEHQGKHKRAPGDEEIKT